MPAELSIDEVLSTIECLHRAASGSRRTLTVGEVAKELGLKRPTLYSRFPEAISALARLRESDGADGRFGRPRDERIREAEDRLRTVRRERDELRSELGVYAERIRHLTTENAKLRKTLEAYAGVRSITD